MDVADMGAQRVRRRTCIVGAGVSGLVAARLFHDRGRDVFVAEAGTEIGGVWTPARSYPGVRAQTPRGLYSFSDFPMPADYPEWPTGDQIYRYLCAYARKFDLLRYIRFGTHVRQVARASAGSG